MSTFYCFSAFARFYFSAVALKICPQNSGIVFTGETGNDKESPNKTKPVLVSGCKSWQKSIWANFKYTALVFNNKSSAGDEKLQVKRIFCWTFSTQCAQEHHVLLQGSLYCSSSKVSCLQGLLHMDFLIFLFLLYL